MRRRPTAHHEGIHHLQQRTRSQNLARNRLPDGQDANAQTAMPPRCWLETQRMAVPLSPTESDTVIRALGAHRLPAACVLHLGQEATAALPQTGFDARRVRRIKDLADRRIALACRFAQWTLAGIQSVAHYEDRHPAQLRELGTDARPVIHLTGNTAPLEVQKQPVRPVVTQWAMSVRAQSIITHTADEIVEHDLTLEVSPARREADCWPRPSNWAAA